MTIKRLMWNAIIGSGILILLSLLVLIVFAVINVMGANLRQTDDRILSSPKTGFFVKADDTQIFVQRVGKKDAPAILFIHGTGAWSEIWRPYMNIAAQMGYQAIAIDLPPFGYSLPPVSGNYNKSAQAKRILATLESLGISQATFVSHSIGSSPLMEALLSEPQRVTKLIMISPALGLESALTDGSDSKLQSVFRHKWLSEAVVASTLTNPDFTTTLVKKFVTEKDKVTEDWVDIYRKPFVLSGSYQAIALWLPELMAGRTELKSDNPESYKSISFAVVLLWGKDDQVTPLSQGNYLHKLIPNSQLLVLDGGHVPMIEEPQQLESVLKLSLAEH